MKLVYVAGPYRAPTESGVAANIRRAEELAIKVWKAGAACICPHKNTAFFGGLCHDDVWLTGDLVILSRCDAVVMMRGWDKSVGASTEHDVAKASGKIEVFYEDRWTEFLDWMELGVRPTATEEVTPCQA
jgi:hypothetical protein